MAYRIRYYVDVDWVPEGVGGSGQGTLEANNPGAGTIGDAQTMRFQGLQYVVGGGYGTAPSGGNFTTATTAMGTDISGQINVAAVLAQIQAWETGGP